MSANDIQVGGDHYDKDGEQHWDRMWRLYGRGYFIGNITKYVERYHVKNGKQDLDKAIHYLEKLKELEYGGNPHDHTKHMGTEPHNRRNEILRAYEETMGSTMLGDALRESPHAGAEHVEDAMAYVNYWKEDLVTLAEKVQARTDQMVEDQKAQGVAHEIRTLEGLANGIKKRPCPCGASEYAGLHTSECTWYHQGEAGRNYVDQ